MKSTLMCVSPRIDIRTKGKVGVARNEFDTSYGTLI